VFNTGVLDQQEDAKPASQLFKLVPTANDRAYQVEFVSKKALELTVARFEKDLQDLMDNETMLERVELGPLFETLLQEQCLTAQGG